MQKRILPIAITAIFIISLIGWSCTKLDTTDIGSDLLPAVDNVNTFDTTLLINSTQSGIYDDSNYLTKFDDYAVGSISNDPLFGSTRASVFMQLKPNTYPYYFGSAGDTIVGPVDSVVLCLKYAGFWGDSMVPVRLEVMEVNDIAFGIDSVYKENSTAYQPIIGASLAIANVDVLTLGNYIRYNNGRDSVRNQIRIKLPLAWATQLFGRDSIKANGTNNAFYNDSIFRRFYNGLAVIGGGGGNGLIYVNIADTSTKLEIHYKVKHNGKIDSTYSSFKLNSTTTPSTINPGSNTANYILRTRSAQMTNPGSGEHFLQTAPGTFINLNIPGLAGLSNRIIHRAEITVEQIPTDPVYDAIFTAPNFLYLDLKDSSTTTPKWKPIYFDLNTSVFYDPDNKSGANAYFLPIDPNTGGIGIDHPYFGGYRRSKTDIFGNPIKYYHFNVSRYVQQVVTDRTPAYDMRLYAPFNITYPQYSSARTAYGNNIAHGRVRIGSGSNPNYKLRLRIVYSKL